MSFKGKARAKGDTKTNWDARSNANNYGYMNAQNAYYSHPYYGYAPVAPVAAEAPKAAESK
jgi:hypothetical protein